MTTIATICAMT